MFLFDGLNWLLVSHHGTGQRGLRRQVPRPASRFNRFGLCDSFALADLAHVAHDLCPKRQLTIRWLASLAHGRVS